MATTLAGRIPVTDPEGKITWIPASKRAAAIDALYAVYGPDGRGVYPSKAELERAAFRPVRLLRMEEQGPQPGKDTGIAPTVLAEQRTVEPGFFAGQPHAGVGPAEFMFGYGKVPAISSLSDWFGTQRGLADLGRTITGETRGPQYWGGEGAPWLARLTGAPLGESKTYFAPTGPEFDQPELPPGVTPVSGLEMTQRRLTGGVLPFATEIGSAIVGSKLAGKIGSERPVGEPVPAAIRYLARPGAMGAATLAGGTIANIERQMSKGESPDIDRALAEGGLGSGYGQGALGAAFGLTGALAEQFGGALVNNAFRKMSLRVQQIATDLKAEPTVAWLNENQRRISDLNTANKKAMEQLDRIFPNGAGSGQQLLVGLKRLAVRARRLGTPEQASALLDRFDAVMQQVGGKPIQVVKPTNEWTVGERVYAAIHGKPPESVISIGRSPARSLSFTELLDMKQTLNQAADLASGVARFQGRQAGTAAAASIETPMSKAIRAQIKMIDEMIEKNPQYATSEKAQKVVSGFRDRNLEMSNRLTVDRFINTKMLDEPLASWRALSSPRHQLGLGRSFIGAARDITGRGVPTANEAMNLIDLGGGRFIPNPAGIRLSPSGEPVQGWQGLDESNATRFIGRQR